jgi:hypothetical protein
LRRGEIVADGCARIDLGNTPLGELTLATATAKKQK